MFDVAIIGGGPAGASAAIFTSKAKKQTIVFDNADGATQYALLKNHYGIKEVEGPELVDIGLEQAASFGAQVMKGTVTNVATVEDGFKLETSAGTFEARHVIFATGEAQRLVEQVGLETVSATEAFVDKVIKVDGSGRTNVKGIWAAGVIAGASPHTIITAGDGARVAVNLISEMNGKRYVDHDVLAG